MNLNELQLRAVSKSTASFYFPDEILADFRRNGKDVAYMDYLNDLEIDRYGPENRTLLRGLLDVNDLELEMKIVRPPSRTPSHLPTSKDSILKKYYQQHLAHVPSSLKPSGCPRATNTVFHSLSSVVYQGWNFNFSPATPLCRAPYVVDVSSAMAQLSVSDQISNPGSLRPIFGNGSSWQPAPFVRLASEKRCSSWSNACIQPYLAGIQLPTPAQDSQKRVVLPQVLPTSEKPASETLVDVDASSEDEMTLSMDSGNCTAGDLSSSGSEISPKSICRESPSPSYASILHTPPSSRFSKLSCTVHVEGWISHLLFHLLAMN